MRLIIVLFLLLYAGLIFSQTSVSGGIYQNTTWTLAGSPYTVTGSIVVFPDRTLTIEPGCEIIFTADNTFNIGNFIYLEIRGTLIALGTDSNKIKFTSSDTTDGFYNWNGINIKGSQGGTCQLDRIELHNSWYGIYNDIVEPGVTYAFTNSRFKNNNYALQFNANLNYTNCIFEKNGVGQAAQISYGSMAATNCQFIQNFCSVTWSNYINLNNCVFTGNTNNIIGCPGSVQNCSFINNAFGFAETSNLQISNCVFEGNDVGIDDNGSSVISNSQFSNNNIAIKLGENSVLTNNTITLNETGLQIRGFNPANTQIANNQICNNLLYNLENLTDKNFQVNANCFCSSDSATIENGIYDGYDDITRGLVNYAIYDDSCTTILDLITKIVLEEQAGLAESQAKWNIFNVNDVLHVSIVKETEVKIYTTTGQLVAAKKLFSGENLVQLDVPPGNYILADTEGNRHRFLIWNK